MPRKRGEPDRAAGLAALARPVPAQTPPSWTSSAVKLGNAREQLDEGNTGLMPLPKPAAASAPGSSRRHGGCRGARSLI